MTPTEEWRPVLSNPLYEVSNLGRVRSLWFGKQRMLRLRRATRDYRAVRLYRGHGQADDWKVHQLVLETFVGPRPEGTQIRHLDGIPHNNALSNLCYGTASENTYDSVRHGTHPQARKTHCPRGHAFTERNTTKYSGERRCRTCMRDRQRIVRAARKAVA